MKHRHWFPLTVKRAPWAVLGGVFFGFHLVFTFHWLQSDSSSSSHVRPDQTDSVPKADNSDILHSLSFPASSGEEFNPRSVVTSLVDPFPASGTEKSNLHVTATTSTMFLTTKKQFEPTVRNIETGFKQVEPDLNHSCFKNGEGRSGGSIGSPQKLDSASACQEFCACTEGCKYFTFWSNGNCHAQDDTSREFKKKEAITGPRSCVFQQEEKQVLPHFRPIQETGPSVGPGPWVYIYDLPARFRNQGTSDDCWTVDCVFGGPPDNVFGVDIWNSEQHHMPKLLHHRFLQSARRTSDVNEADIFFIPAYSFHPDKETQCADNKDLFQTLFKLNPLLKSKEWAAKKASRHLFADARGYEVCNYLWENQMPFRLFHRINIALNSLRDDGPEGWTLGKPWVWYQFPYPAAYHGRSASVPAKLRQPGLAKYLWAYTGTGRGIAGLLRQVIMKQCTGCNRCGRTSPNEAVKQDVARFAAVKLQSFFCVEPPGDTITRKSIVDSIVLGCIPVFFAHQQLNMYDLFFTAEEFAAAVVFVPEARVLGPVDPGKLSRWALGPPLKNKLDLASLYPSEELFFKSMHPYKDPDQRRQQVREMYPKATPILEILEGISLDEIKRKQAALASIAHRLVIGLDDSDSDAVRILLDRIVSNDALAAQLSRSSKIGNAEKWLT